MPTNSYSISIHISLTKVAHGDDAEYIVFDKTNIYYSYHVDDNQIHKRIEKLVKYA